MLGRRLPHRAGGVPGHDRDRRRRARRGRRAGRAPVRDRVPGGRRGAPRRARWPGPGSRPRTSSSSCCAGSARAAARTRCSSSPGPGTADLSIPERGDDREHDRRARRHRGGVPARREHARVADDARSARTTSPTSGPTTAPSTTTASRSTSTSSGRWWPSRTTPTTSCRSRRSAGTRDRAGVHGLVGQLGLLRPGAAGRGAGRPRRADRAPERSPRPPRPGSRQILAAIAESGVYRQLVGGRRADARAGVRAVRRHGPGAAVGRELAAHVQPQLPRPQRHRRRTRVYLCSPAVAAVSMLERQDRATRASTATRPRCSPMPELQARTSTTSTSSRRPPEDEAERIEIPRGPNIKTPPEHEPLGDVARGARRDRPARRHLDRRPRARRRRGDGLPLEHPGDRRVHAPPPRPRVPQATAGVGQRLHRRRRQLRPGLVARARRAGAAAAGRQGGVRQVVRAHPPAQPGRAGHPRAHVRRRRPTTTGRRWGRSWSLPNAARGARGRARTRSAARIEDSGERAHADATTSPSTSGRSCSPGVCCPISATATDPPATEATDIFVDYQRKTRSRSVSGAVRSARPGVARPTRPRSS